ncbi:MAG: type I methionyl aminopeptidase [Phycisphaerae bacterium]|jgi:methionyl aminopeptidase|nr:type I methionyl aminopeptidase [Phycisphaerae bacterium]HOO18409.1 type I methionyl aminopeptidase [Phycisphaerae bacterium]HPC23229.1 type I methionyl aminopeptidase [Phycisphaerae bacterium]HRS27073.1 type I methionyl aminopeptidase [Phycisphaerae bacterium]HRT40683.1 type I methionyl aminopeptidase [Phycisphaerae bacterium]
MKAAGARIVLKSAREIELMRAAGRLVYEILCELQRRIRPGVTTAELDRVAGQMIRDAGATALFLGVRNPQARCPFPASICASVNEAVVHGIPDDRPLMEGDIVSVDCGVRLKGYCGDAARTFAVGRISPESRKLLDVTQQMLALALSEIRPGVRWGTIARKMQKYVEGEGFGVVREFVGHGIGREMHEEPKVPNAWGRGLKNMDFELVPGMILAIEPMVTAGSPEVEFGDDAYRWAVVTKDRRPAAHFEDTVAVTANGPDVLTDGR